MERFKEFYKKFTESDIVEESLEARIDELTSTGIFSHFGRDAIESRFEFYKNKGIVPTKRLNKGATQASGSRARRGEGSGGIETIDVTEKEYEEMLPYIFKFVDKEVRDKLEEAYKDDEKKSGKLEKHYKDVTLRPVEEDASQISGVLGNWLVLRHNKKLELPKSLRQKLNFTTLQSKVDEAYQTVTGATVSGDSKSGVDSDMPEGFSFVKESGAFRLYKWSALGDVCSLDPNVKQNWMSIVVNLAGDVTENWCVASENYAKQYGEPDGSGKFKNPFYLLRKKDGDSFKPYVLMHGDSLQCKDISDAGIDEATAEEIYPHIKSHLETIIFG